FLHYTAPHLVLKSFPTRRSSDLSILRTRQNRIILLWLFLTTILNCATPVIADAQERMPSLIPTFSEIKDRTEGRASRARDCIPRSEEHTSELQSRFDLVCRLLLE